MLKMLSRVSVELVVFVAIITSIVSAASATEDSWLGPEFSVLQKVYDDCLNRDDFTGCLKGRALVALDKAINQDSISVVDGIFMEKQNETDVEKTPEFADARVLNDLTGIDRQLMEKISTFLRTHVLKVDLSEERGGGGFGGSKGGLGGGGIGNKNKLKLKKSGGYIIAGLLMAMGIAGPIALKALAAIAGKALIITKKSYRYIIAALLTIMGIAAPLAMKAVGLIAYKALVISSVALTIAGIIALKKIYSSDHHDETTFHVASGDHRRTAYLVRGPNGQQHHGGAPTGQPDSQNDPYRYYYDYPAQQSP